MMEEQIATKISQELGESATIDSSKTKPRRLFIQITKDQIRIAIKMLKIEGFSHLSAITGLETENKEMEILYHLDQQGTLLTLRVVLDENVDSLNTITDIIPGASLYEREIHDLFGIKFAGHPELKKLILPDEYAEESHPMRSKPEKAEK